MGQVYEMAAHLLLAKTPFSRNKNFEAHDDPRFRDAIALYRRLRSLVRDLERARREGARVAVIEESQGGRVSIRLEITAPTSRQTSFIEQPAWEVLMLHPAARAAIASMKKSAA